MRARQCVLRSAVVAITLTAGVSHAEVRLPNLFSDRMVLQRDHPNRVWGTADPGEAVTVRIAGVQKAATADADGAWSVELDPLAAGGPHELTVAGTNTVTRHDVLVGEVWICSGQSNMRWQVRKSDEGDLTRVTANDPELRLITFPNVGSQTPIWTHEKHAWTTCSPQTVGKFSAVGYHFGKILREALGVPVGLINNAWGGSAADAWIDQAVLDAWDDYQPSMRRWDKLATEYEALESKHDRSEEEKKRHEELRLRLVGRHRPGNIYHGVLASHLGYGIRGVIWYQGESNASRAYQYRDLFPLMIGHWRERWGIGDFPFYWVQLADYQREKPAPAQSGWAELREAQTMALDRLPNTGQAVIIDAGEGKDIHPTDKRVVGARLARLALASDYDFDLACRSPRFRSMEVVEGKAVLSFDHVDGGWRPFDVKEPIGFAIAGADKRFVWADAKILDDGRIEVRSDAVPEPVAVRYAWADNPVCNLYDRAGLPCTPFRTDDWPGVTVDRR